MAHLIPLSRLARLVGQPRSALQKLAQSGELKTFDGAVELDEVLRLFPDITLEDERELTRVAEIKEQALTKQARTELPDAEVLYERLKTLSREAAAAHALARHYERVHGWIGGRLADAVEQGQASAAFASEFSAWLRRELAAPAEDLRRWTMLFARERMMQVMSAQVTVLPKGQTFEVLGNETLLEAGLRAGLPLPYGCNNGSCGDCKCRVVSGEVVKARPHDYVLSAADKAQGHTLACAYSAVGDISIEVPSLGTGDIPEQTIKVRVRTIEPLSPQRVAVHLVTSRAERLRYLAGQRLEITIGGERREVPAASCPCDERRIEVHVPTGRGAAFDALATALKVNDEVTIRGPYGGFVLDDASERPLLLIASGPGFGPVKSLLQHALSLERAPTIGMFRLAGSRGEPIYQENLLKSYAGALDHFRYVPFPAEVPFEAALDHIAISTAGLAGYDAYVAGEAEFVEAARGMLCAAGLPEARFRGAIVD